MKDFFRDDYKGWELSTCLSNYFCEESSPIAENLKLFIGLRNKIEHRSLPALDHCIFGECQAMLLNFEDMLFHLFGPEHALTESMALALQFSHLRDPKQDQAIRSLQLPLATDIAAYIDSFRSSLSDDLRNDLAFSYRVFLIPQLATRPSASDLAVQFVKFDPDTPKEMEKYNEVTALLKPTVTQVANQSKLNAGGCHFGNQSHTSKLGHQVLTPLHIFLNSLLLQTPSEIVFIIISQQTT